MAITSIRRDWGVSPSIVRITTTDDLATITTIGYLNDEAENIRQLNSGAFEWEDGDLVAIDYSDGEGLFTRDSANDTFDALPASPGTLSETLQDGEIFVGSALNVATGVAMSGDVAIDNTGATTIQANAVELGMLASGIAPSHVIKFGGQVTTVGGAAAEAFAVVGALAASDRAFVQMVDDGTNNVSVLNAVVTNDTLTVTFSADPGNDAIINYQIIRAAA